MATDTSACETKAIRTPSGLRVPFNRPFLTGRELKYIQEAVQEGHISGNGAFTKACQTFFRQRYGFEQCLLTTSCTDALEMCALLLDIKPEDEVILPAYTFVSTANAFALRGANLRFADSCVDNPNIDPAEVERLITSRTKAVIVVHYGGIACDMTQLMKLCHERGIPLVEDAAHAIDSFFIPPSSGPRPLGSFGDLATFSFHETKNVICGEGGLLVVNNSALWKRAEIIWEKGTDRAAFARGEVQKYRWVDLGSSFLPSDMVAAFLLSQLECLDEIQSRRIDRWQRYKEGLAHLVDGGYLKMPSIPAYATVNGHLFPILLESSKQREDLAEFLGENNIQALFHYLPLNESPYFMKFGQSDRLLNATRYSDCLLRLPLFFDLTLEQIANVCDSISRFFKR